MVESVNLILSNESPRGMRSEQLRLEIIGQQRKVSVLEWED